MNKNNILFKIFSLSILAINLVFLIWFIIDAIKVISKIIIFKNIHIILLSVVIILDIIYFCFVVFKLVKNNKIKKAKIKNLE